MAALRRHYDVITNIEINIFKQLITQLLSCVGAGALLGLAMIDILPELREKISSIPKEYTHAGSSHSAHAESSSRHSDFHSEEEESGFFSDHYPLGSCKIRVLF